jgi:exonuclease III
MDLKVVFWNANCWNSINCEKIAATALSSDADVICITDARSDQQKSRYLDGYLATLKRVTGKNWRGKIESRASRKSKCSVGGDILFFSDQCSKVAKTALLPLGTATCLKLVWGGKEFRIISVYRPYDSPLV